jgi:PKHD-type hydroxylase
VPLVHDCPNAFSAAQCDVLVAMTEAAALEPGRVYAGAGYARDPAVRDVETSFHPRGRETAWIYERLDALFAEAAGAFGLAVGPMREPIQLMRYRVGGHFRAWHGDAGYDKRSERLISVSVELSEPGDHEGGDLEIMPAVLGPGRRLPRGGARFFRSQALHRVTPVTRGVRHALVNWAGAPLAEDRSSSPA